MPTILLVRHGQASFGADDYDLLSPVGREQAGVVADSLARRGYRPSRIVSGSMRRQIETAAAFAGVEAEIDRRWNEYDSNDVLSHHSETPLRLDGPQAADQEPLTSKGFQAILEPALDAWIATAEQSPTAVTWPQFSGAGSEAMTQLAGELKRGETAVVVSSGGVIAAVAGTLLGAAAPVFSALNRVLVNASITKLVIGDAGTNLVSFNDHSHLEDVDRSLVTYR